MTPQNMLLKQLSKFRGILLIDLDQNLEIRGTPNDQIISMQKVPRTRADLLLFDKLNCQASRLFSNLFVGTVYSR